MTTLQGCIMTPDAEPDESGWARREVWAYDMASTGMGGDEAVGIGYESRYVHDNGDGTFGVATFLYFAERCETTNQPEVRESHVVTGMYIFTVCTDPEEPGHTELSCDIQYDRDVSSFFHDDLADAQRICRRHAVSDERFAITWDGRS